MDWAVIGPILAGVGALTVGISGLASRRDSRKIAEVSADQVKLNTAWTIQERMFEQQSQQIANLTKINEDLMTRQTDMQKAMNALEVENSSLKSKSIDLQERVMELEEKLRRHGIDV